MAEMNCEKNENCCFFHMTTPCANHVTTKNFQLQQYWQPKSIFGRQS